MLGITFFMNAFIVILFPYWGCLLFGTIPPLGIGLVGIETGWKIKDLAPGRRISFVLLGLGYVVGGIVLALRIAEKISQDGWLGRFP